MADPGLPPKGRSHSLHLLESLVQEEEAKLQNRGEPNVVIPTETRESTESGSPDFYDSDKQQIKSGGSPTASYSEFKMKEVEINSKVSKANPNAGFRGKKIKKQRSRSNSGERSLTKSKKVMRPFSADYNQNKRSKLNSNMRNGRPKTSKGLSRNSRTSSPKGQRPRSPRSYSSDSYSSDEEYIKKKNYRSDSENSLDRKDKDSFFDSDSDKRKNIRNPSPRRSNTSDSCSSDNTKNKYERNGRSRSRSTNSESSSSDRENSKRKSRDSRRRSLSSDSSDEDSNSRDVRLNGHDSGKNSGGKSGYSRKGGNQKPKSSDGGKIVVVEDYSTLSESDDGRKRPVRQEVSKPPTHPKKSKPLLSRKKQEGYKIFQIDPDLYLEGKLQQKYSELEELMTCSFVDQKSHMTRHHLYQMELLRDQYQNASHGLPSAATIIPRSLPGEIRNRSSKRPVSAKQASSGRRIDSDLESNGTYDHAYGTLRSVMGAERARQTDKIRTDILVERPASGKRSTKKKKKLDTSSRGKKSDTEEEISDRPSFSSTLSKNSSSPRTPRGIDDHIKYSENEKLKKWLKEKDRIYRKQVKEERQKKREEREVMVKQANEKLVRRIESQKYVKKWMKQKSKEWVKIQKEKREKEKEDDEWLESYKKNKSVPGDTLRIRPQSAPSQRSETKSKEDVQAERDHEEEQKQAKRAQEGPHPPQTKFIYKRPVAGKIKLKMQVRGKSPVAQKSDTEEQSEENEKEKAKQMRMSYDEWVKKKRIHDAIRKENAKKQREMAKSDPELERLIPAIGRKRIEDKLNSRKRIDTGIKRFDSQTNKSFGGGEFDGEPKERPRSAYRLESDRGASDGPPLMVKQLNRPSTAPSSRGRVPSPKKSANSPRKAIIPQRVDQVMANEDTENPFSLPFSPEKGIPAHVAERQKRIFADQVVNNLNEIEQRALLQAELIKEGVSDADIAEFAEKSRQEIDQPLTKIAIDTEAEEKVDEHPKITDIMYSPKRPDSSDSSSDEGEKNVVEEKETSEVTDTSVDNEVKEDVIKCESPEPVTETFKANDANEAQENEAQSEEQVHEKDKEQGDSSDGHRHYKTYENLNELNLESSYNDDTLAQQEEEIDHLKEEIEQLKEKVEHLVVQPEIHLNHPDEVKPVKEPTVTIFADSDPNLVGILKESKKDEKSENIPVPEMSEEPEKSTTNKADDNEGPASPREELSNSRKRVSFNEQTEVFQSFESTSTETVTPEPEEFDPKAEGLDAQQSFDDFDDDDDEDDRPAILKLQGEKMTINIGGMVLNPTLIDSKPEGDLNDNEKVTDDKNETEKSDEENKPTFLTSPDDESNV
ncbi:hypothetical protein ACF0H5_016091 [Mactra antiquata]